MGLVVMAACGDAALEEPSLATSDQKADTAVRPPSLRPHWNDPAQPIPSDLPEAVDHELLQTPLRSQGARLTCVPHAWAAAVEAHYGLTHHLSVEQLWAHLGSEPNELLEPLKGFAFAAETDWPYGGVPVKDLEARSVYRIEEVLRLPSADPEAVLRHVAGSSRNNVVMAICSGYTVIGSQIRSLVPTDSLYLERPPMCGRHAVLVVGYERRWDPTYKRERTYLKIKDSSPGRYLFMPDIWVVDYSTLAAAVVSSPDASSPDALSPDASSP